MGCLYFLGAMGLQAVKIGFTSNDPKLRLKELQTGNPHALQLLLVREGTMGQEAWLHNYFKELWIRGEWFRLEGHLASFVSWAADRSETHPHLIHELIDMYGEVA
jgi:hypothetical protein